MFRRQKNIIFEIYKFNPEKNAFTIEVDLDSYVEIFNEWDFSPFKRKDIDPELKIYLEDCAMDIPHGYNLMILMHLPEEAYDQKKQDATMNGIWNYFRLLVALEKRNIRPIHKKTGRYSFLGMCFLTMAYLLGSDGIRLPLQILQEGIFVGGWVFIWEAFSEFFFESREVRKKIQVYERFLDADIDFVYEKKQRRL